MSNEAETFRARIEDGKVAAKRLEVELRLMDVRLRQVAGGNVRAIDPAVEVMPRMMRWLRCVQDGFDAVWWRDEWEGRGGFSVDKERGS